MQQRVRGRVAAILAVVVSTALFGAVGPVPAAPAGRSFISVKVSTIDAVGVTDDAPTGIVGTAVNVTTGQSFDLTEFAGTLATENLPDGAYRLRVAGDGTWAPVWWPGVYSEAAASTFTLKASATGCSTSTIGPAGCYGLSFTAMLPQMRSLSGAVSTRQGQRVPGVPVTARLVGQAPTSFTATSDSSGQFFFALPPGTYELSAPNGNRMATETVDVLTPSVSRSLLLLDVPSAPTEVRATPGNASVTIGWAPPADNGGSAVTGYSAVAQPGGLTCTSSARSCVITGLTNNQPYSVSVAATNAVGTSPVSGSVVVTARELPPGAPTAVRALAQSRSATVSWTPPADASSVNAYRVTSTPGGQVCTTSTLSCAVAGLTNGTRYRFRVVALNGGGESAASAESNRVTPADLPAVPRNVRVNAGNSSILVRWLGPTDNGGATITGYTATSFPSGRTCSTDGSVRGCAIGGLTNGAPYSIVVTATNRIGTSERSAGSASATPSAALPPLASRVRVTPTSGKVTRAVTLRWSASAPARQVSVNWQVSTSVKVVTKSGSPTGSLRVPVRAGTRVRVWVQALDAKRRPVGEVRRTYRR